LAEGKYKNTEDVLNALVQEDFFPTALQRNTLRSVDAELISIIKRWATADGFVVIDLGRLARRFHAWPESRTQRERQQFVRERVAAFVWLGVLLPVDRARNRQDTRSYVVAGIQGRPLRNGSNPTHTGRHEKLELTAEDKAFLGQCCITAT
jgi:hypothetical protein